MTIMNRTKGEDLQMCIDFMVHLFTLAADRCDFAQLWAVGANVT